MSVVRRCDNPDCTNGPAGTRNVSDQANPDGWLTVTVTTIVGGRPTPADACSGDCAVLMTQAAPDVAATLTLQPATTMPLGAQRLLAAAPVTPKPKPMPTPPPTTDTGKPDVDGPIPA